MTDVRDGFLHDMQHLIWTGIRHNHRKHSQNRRSAGRKRLFERARTPSWWRRARVSSRRSRRVARRGTAIQTYDTMYTD
jgi:hypothetical protein